MQQSDYVLVRISFSYILCSKSHAAISMHQQWQLIWSPLLEPVTVGVQTLNSRFFLYSDQH